MDNSVLENTETPEMDNSQEEQIDDVELEDVEADEEETTDDEAESEDPASIRRKQQLEWSRQEVERLKKIVLETAIDAASRDSSTLIALHEKDPKLANEVAKHYGYENYSDLKKTLKLGQDEEEDDFETKYKQRRAKEDHNEAIEKISTKIWKLSDWIKEEVQEYFDDLAEWKNLNYEKAMKLYDMAVTYAKKDKMKEDKLVDTKKWLSSTGVSKSTPQKKEQIKTIVRDGRLVILD